MGNDACAHLLVHLEDDASDRARNRRRPAFRTGPVHVDLVALTPDAIRRALA
ncbi:hypothetical protein [Cellulomonas bogoriensis]|uniref:hypothetical protein n=1 Tax=Cellulomonas bogoriensis TaxID=301388 RepID=UPI000ABD9278|nr:hypothetical protein [Cellulomonas bogoriensis]